jgi:hypothetical protein
VDPDPAFQVNQDPDPIRIQSFDDQNLKKKIKLNFCFKFFLSKISIYLSLASIKDGLPYYRRSLQLFKEIC